MPDFNASATTTAPKSLPGQLLHSEASHIQQATSAPANRRLRQAAKILARRSGAKGPRGAFSTIRRILVAVALICSWCSLGAIRLSKRTPSGEKATSIRFHVD